MQSHSGSGATLLWLRPLRTVREPFDSYRSSLYNAARYDDAAMLRMSCMKLLVAIGMHQYAVICTIGSAVNFPGDMMTMPTGLDGDLLIADGAASMLPLP